MFTFIFFLQSIENVQIFVIDVYYFLFITIFICIKSATFNLWCILCDTNEFQCPGIDNTCMSTGTGDSNRMISGNQIQIIPGRETMTIRKEVMIPSPASDPCAGSDVSVCNFLFHVAEHFSK